jgi:translation initiation factor 2B subunit (eIF-2B alpha/beta/delta family)
MGSMKNFLNMRANTVYVWIKISMIGKQGPHLKKYLSSMTRLEEICVNLHPIESTYGMDWKDDLRKFESDNTTGSAELLEQYIELLLFWLEKGELKLPKDKTFLMDHVKRLEDNHRSLMVFLHFSSRVIEMLNRSVEEDWNKALEDFLIDYSDHWKGVNIRLAMQANTVIDLHQKLVLCHSQSSAVREIFSAFEGNKKKVRILQTESRPVLEGRMQAVNLHQLGYEVKLITDTGYARHLDRINMILLGADAVYRDYFVNKTGSYNICLAGKNAGIPVYIIADSRKFWFSLPSGYHEMQFSEKKKPGEEIWKDPQPGIEIENFYFEKIPVSWADGFITEKETLKPSQIQKLQAG